MVLVILIVAVVVEAALVVIMFVAGATSDISSLSSQASLPVRHHYPRLPRWFQVSEYPALFLFPLLCEELHLLTFPFLLLTADERDGKSGRFVPAVIFFCFFFYK